MNATTASAGQCQASIPAQRSSVFQCEALEGCSSYVATHAGSCPHTLCVRACVSRRNCRESGCGPMPWCLAVLGVLVCVFVPVVCVAACTDMPPSVNAQVTQHAGMRPFFAPLTPSTSNSLVATGTRRKRRRWCAGEDVCLPVTATGLCATTLLPPCFGQSCTDCVSGSNSCCGYAAVSCGVLRGRRE